VKRGEVIGTVGTTGNAQGTPPHLHFEVKPNGGASIDPYALLRVWCG
jgi:murein DD-endopeptidase MepM/ murein hydrolase activator NlpD